MLVWMKAFGISNVATSRSSSASIVAVNSTDSVITVGLDDSAKSEMQQLHDRECWTPISVESMTQKEKSKALESLIFLVEKKSGKIKARHCANGSKQRKWMTQEETTSPTVMTESVLLTATIEAEEHRDVATFDIPNAFIQTNVDEVDAHGDRIVMKIKGAMIYMP